MEDTEMSKASREWKENIKAANRFFRWETSKKVYMRLCRICDRNKIDKKKSLNRFYKSLKEM
jgi:hypothetical protein